MVVDSSIPYMAYCCVYMQEYHKQKKTHLPTSIFVMVITFWLGVTNAWLNLVKASVKLGYSLYYLLRVHFSKINRQ